MSDMIKMMQAIQKLGASHNKLCDMVEAHATRLKILETAVKNINEDMKTVSEILEGKDSPDAEGLIEGEEIVG